MEEIRRWRRAVGRRTVTEGQAPSASNKRRRPPIEVRRFAGPDAHREQLDHLRVAHLTDLHFGRVTPLRIQEMAVELTNAAHPDLVVITGDFVCHSQAYLEQLSEVLSQLDAPTVGVLGNHDYWSGADGVLGALDRAGVEMLRNQNTTITLRHQALQVVGLDDAYTGHADREAATRGLRRDRPTIALSHIAEEADALWDRGAPLVLSGHTHAGQVTLAGLHELSIGRVAGHKYVHGLYGRRTPSPGEGPRGAVYVGAGIGASVMPVRLGDRGRREVTLFELGAQVGAFEEHHEEQPPLPGREPSDKLKAKRAENVRRKRERRERRRRERES